MCTMICGKMVVGRVVVMWLVVCSDHCGVDGTVCERTLVECGVVAMYVLCP